jgi:hypothetical protein
LLTVPPGVVTAVALELAAAESDDGDSVSCATAREQSIASVIAANIDMDSGFRRHFMVDPHFVWYEIFLLIYIQRRKEAELIVD